MSDTIFALSSAPGRAGVAVVRISGPGAGAALEALAGGIPEPRAAKLTALRDPGSGEEIDRGLVLWFPTPHSFTGEDVAELHLHGGRAVVDGAIGALMTIPGLRPAEAGEFTRRAFDNGKLDLSEVEGLADLIQAETVAQRRQALRQMGGALSSRTEDWRARLIRAAAHLEATIDFADEDLPADAAAAVAAELDSLRHEIAAVLDDGGRAERLRDGLRVAIVGPPNAGKSSLLNALARRDVAIVSEIAGTTRDVIEVHLDLGGYPVTLLDTAGLRELAGDGGHDAIEAEGMRRARAGAAAADLRLAVFDLGAGGNWAGEKRAGEKRAGEMWDRATVELLDADSLVVLNKVDLVTGASPGKVAGHPAMPISVKTGQGLPELIARLTDEASMRLGGASEAAPITRARHRAALSECAAALARAAEAPAVELAAEDLRLAARALGRVAGRVDVEDLLDVIFRDFCIGK